jgi:transposase
MLAFVDPETLIPADHPLRTIKRFADAALVELSPLFDQVYAADGQGRPSIPPERLLKASLLISLYSVRSERAFCEELTYHLLFRWFLDMDLVEAGFDHSTFSKNRARLLRHRPRSDRHATPTLTPTLLLMLMNSDRSRASAISTSRWTARGVRPRVSRQAQGRRAQSLG